MASTQSHLYDGSAGVVHLRTRNACSVIHFLKLAMDAREMSRVSGPDGISVLHCELQVGLTLVMVCDDMQAWGVSDTSGMTPPPWRIMVENVDQLVGQCAGQGAEILTPPGNAFWGERYACVRDPFGNEWVLAQMIEPMSPEEQAHHARQALGGNQNTSGPHA